MEKSSVFIFKTHSPKPMSTTACSPGNNPFDDILKKTIETTTLTEWKNRRSSLQLPENLPDIGRQSLSFQDLNASDFGRESIGILPPDFGRDIHGFMNMSFEISLESQAIFQLNAFRDSISFRRESLNLTDFGRESLDCCRESLGILKIRSPDVKFGDEDKKIPEIILTTIENSSDYVCNPLDIAFLNSYSKKSSVTSSTASSITPSFNSVSLEGPSAIYSSFVNKKEENNESDVLNQAFLNLDEYSAFSGVSSVCSPLYKVKFSSSDLAQCRSRIQSLPTSLHKSFEISNGALDFGLADGKFWTADRTAKAATLERRNFHRTLDFDDASDEFLDSVFIEGHHLAEKIADGSILNDSTGNEIGILDCTPQPNWPDELSYREPDKEVKCDTETVFKAVDKMLPPPQQNVNYKIKTCKTDSTSNENSNDNSNISTNSKSSCSSENDDSKAIQNLSNITRGSDKYCTNRRSASVSKDAKEILHNLSEILNCTHPNDQQKSEGQNLLSSLADILCVNNSSVNTNDPNDSGHSSTNEAAPDSPKKDSHECFEVLDLRTKSASEGDPKDDSANKNVILDLSLKLKPEKNRRLSQSLSSKRSIVPNINKKNVSLLGFDANKNRNLSGDSSVNSNDSKNVSNMSKLSIAGKLRQKCVNNVKKGPMKAMIPVGNMKKGCNVAVTPEKNEQKNSAMQSNKTSTPINEPKLRPVAASTPASKKNTKEALVSPLNRFKKRDGSPVLRRESTGGPCSALPRLLNIDSKLLRRNSISEVKKTDSAYRVKRSNSVENESGVMSSLATVRQNIVNSPYYQLKKQNVLKENNFIEMDNKKLEKSKGLPVGKASHSAKSKISDGPSVNDPLTKLSSPKQKKCESARKDQNQNIIPTKLPVNTSERAVERRKSFVEIKLLKEKSAPAAVERRNSLSDIKRTVEKPVQKSISMRKESGIMSSLAKIRQNILNSPFYSKQEGVETLAGFKNKKQM